MVVRKERKVQGFRIMNKGGSVGPWKGGDRVLKK